jgi:CheY-like chemotaxis protein
MRLLLCDDDARVRSVISELATDRGHVIVGEAENSLEAITVLSELQPDAVVLDLSLKYGSGYEVLTTAVDLGIRVIVFSAYAENVLPDHHVGLLVVDKPDFSGLEQALDALEAWVTARDTERAERRTRPPIEDGPSLHDPQDSQQFYEALANAMPLDVLMSVELEIAGTPEEIDDLADTVAKVVRSEDRVLRTAGGARVYLIGGAEQTAQLVAARIEAAWSVRAGTALRWRSIVIGQDETSADAFERLKAQSPTAR